MVAVSKWSYADCILVIRLPRIIYLVIEICGVDIIFRFRLFKDILFFGSSGDLVFVTTCCDN